MRLSQQQKTTIIQTVHQGLGTDVQISLYGSRTDDQSKGGDVDLLLDVKQSVTLLQLARIKLNLETLLGLPVDLLVSRTGKTASAFEKIARAQAQPLVAA